MSRIQRIQAYDFVSSFEEAVSDGHPRRIVSTDGKEILSESIWLAGLTAFEFLLQNVRESETQEKPLEMNAEAMQKAFGQLWADTEKDLEAHFLPQFLELVDAGVVYNKSQPITKAHFLEIWKHQSTDEHAMNFLRTFKDLPIFQVIDEDVEGYVGSIAALCILALIDDAAIASFLDDHETLTSCSTDIAECRSLMESGARVRSAVKTAMTAKAQAGGQAKYRKHNEAKAFVLVEWQAHRAAYANNKSAFSRDYTRRVIHEFGVQVTEKTIREVWLLDTPATSKRAG